MAVLESLQFALRCHEVEAMPMKKTQQSIASSKLLEITPQVDFQYTIDLEFGSNADSLTLLLDTVSSQQG